jgi:hypothetical protein
MTAMDFLKAFVTALIVMVLNVAISFVVVWVYAIAIDPGHDPAYYEAKAQDIAPWSSVFFGVVLFYLAGMIGAIRRPQRNAIAFALTAAAIYIAIDAAVIYAAGAFSSLGDVVPISFFTKAVAALAGARMGIHRRSLAST